MGDHPRFVSRDELGDSDNFLRRRRRRDAASLALKETDVVVQSVEHEYRDMAAAQGAVVPDGAAVEHHGQGRLRARQPDGRDAADVETLF
jgi:hypothetical protein